MTNLNTVVKSGEVSDKIQNMNFIGHFYHALEQKGRIAIPATFREMMGDRVILSQGIESCIYLFPLESWEQTISQAPLHPFVKKSERQWLQLITHNSYESLIDNQGRVLINDSLISYAKLTKACVVAGSVHYVEIWDRDSYHTYMDELEKNRETIIENKYDN